MLGRHIIYGCTCYVLHAAVGWRVIGRVIGRVNVATRPARETKLVTLLHESIAVQRCRRRFQLLCRHHGVVLTT